MTVESPGPAETAKHRFRVNGEERFGEQGLTVSALLADLGLEEDRVAVELDREILRREAWATTEVENGSALEIVHFVGGG